MSNKKEELIQHIEKELLKLPRIKKSEIETGDAFLTSGTGFLANTIEFFERQQKDAIISGTFSHSGLAVVNDKISIIEAQAPGIVKRDFAKRYLNDKYDYIVVLKPRFKIDKEVFEKQMTPYINHSKYDFKNLLFFQPIKILTGKWLGDKVQNTNRFICHEWTAFNYNLYMRNNKLCIFPNEVSANSKNIWDNIFFEKHLLKFHKNFN